MLRHRISPVLKRSAPGVPLRRRRDLLQLHLCHQSCWYSGLMAKRRFQPHQRLRGDKLDSKTVDNNNLVTAITLRIDWRHR